MARFGWCDNRTGSLVQPDEDRVMVEFLCMMTTVRPVPSDVAGRVPWRGPRQYPGLLAEMIRRVILSFSREK
jgi:hypothetical protein